MRLIIISVYEKNISFFLPEYIYIAIKYSNKFKSPIKSALRCRGQKKNEMPHKQTHTLPNCGKYLNTTLTHTHLHVQTYTHSLSADAVCTAPSVQDQITAQSYFP